MEQVMNSVKNNWVAIVAIMLAVSTCLKAIRDAIDTTPATDDNAFEHFVTIFSKIVAYIFAGKRAS